MHESDIQYLERACELAWCGLGVNSPNPLVGCVIVKDGKVIGEGAHVYEKISHAETVALESAGENGRGATLYVTLEPCNHTGRTSPCTMAIIEAGIDRIVYGIDDPNPGVKGGGALYLAHAGLKVEKCADVPTIKRIIDQNRFFIRRVRANRPWVTIKSASSLDGKIATRDGDSHWITSLESRSAVHTLRGIYDAILIGKDTALKDDPQLTYRPEEHGNACLPDILFPITSGKLNNPVRVVIDPALTLPRELRVFNTEQAPTSAICREDADAEKGRRLSAQGVQIIRVGSGEKGIDLSAAVGELAQMGIQSLLVEGGGETSGKFFDAGIVDEVNIFLAPIIIGGRDAVNSIAGTGFGKIDDCARLEDVRSCSIAGDILVTGRIRWSI